MKKLVIILLLLCAYNVYTIDIIDFQLSLEMGMIPKGTFKVYDFTRRVYEPSFYGDFNFETQMFNNLLFVGVGAKIHLWKVIANKSFKPDAINFLFFAGFRFNESIELGFRHYCDHPIKSWDNGSTTNLESWYEEIYIKITLGSK